LFKGLEVLFADNPFLPKDNRTAFLAEAWPAGKPLSVRPLVETEPKPGDRLVRRVLDTFLIPGYLAYEWKHQRGIPVVGCEDPDLYRTGAGLGAGRADARRTKLWLRAVAARNRSMAQTLVEQAGRHDCPVLFLGGRHLQPPAAGERLSEQDWQ